MRFKVEMEIEVDVDHWPEVTPGALGGHLMVAIEGAACAPCVTVARMHVQELGEEWEHERT